MNRKKIINRLLSFYFSYPKITANPNKIKPAMFGFDPSDPDRFTPYRPARLKVLDRIISAMDLLFGRTLALDEEELIDEACRRTGLSDFGDNSFREPLKLICDLSKKGTPQSAFGRMSLNGDCLNRLMNKLYIHAKISAHPEILNEEISKPIFILGLPRTGTSLLQRLFAQDPANRVLFIWEMNHPILPSKLKSYDTDPRIEGYEKSYAFVNYVMPALKAIHRMDVHDPEECIYLMANNLVSGSFIMRFKEYSDWYNAQDLTGSYEFHKRQLQMLQWKCRRDRWVLKSPIHLSGLKALLKVYPDARIIQTHRDPLEVIASTASLFTILRGGYFNKVDHKAIGSDMVEELNKDLVRGMNARSEEEQRGDSNVIFQDMYYTDLIANPVGTVEKIYNKFGIKLTENAAQCMRQFLKENQQNKFGEHDYKMERFGLNPSTVQKRFQWYYEHFTIPISYNLKT